MRKLLAGLCLVLAALPATAGVIKQAVPLAIDAGGVCAGPAKGARAAPKTRDGQVTLHPDAYDFLVPGDRVPAAVDMGIGLVLQFQDFTPGETITLQGQLLGVDPQPDTWTQELRPDGLLWFGFMPTPTLPIDVGTYRFRVKRGDETLLVYELKVRKAKGDEANLCHADIS